jgi:hypothetical protein
LSTSTFVLLVVYRYKKKRNLGMKSIFVTIDV